ncbi:MAG TPA: DUF488 family protein [Methylomirabilota bacterium]|nr:DUF488 family protein [Methylomirabilota bacterium]
MRSRAVPRIRIKRAYERASRDDGARVLVDRLWPRGVSRRALALDEWAKDIAPSDQLRRWFGHDPRRWKEFVSRYREELRAPAARERLEALARRARARPLTLVYGARDEQHNDAVVIADALRRRSRRVARSAPRRAA